MALACAAATCPGEESDIPPAPPYAADEQSVRAGVGHHGNDAIIDATPLATLGERICILGPPASGKSTLAHAIGQTRGLPPIHLDRLRHLPGTAWVERPDTAFHALHATAIARERWVMDGNYLDLWPARSARATGVILLDLAAPVSLFRYLRRCWWERDRAGALPGGSDRATWEMVGFILLASRVGRRRRTAIFAATSLPKLFLPTPRAVARFRRANALAGRSSGE